MSNVSPAVGAAASAVEQKMLDETRAEVGIADHKSSMVLAALGIGFGALLGALLANDWRPSTLEGASEVAWWVAAAFSLGAVVCAGAAVWPRYTKADVSKGIYYWGHVATYNTLSEFETAMGQHPPAQGDRTRHQLWRLSKIVDRKYTLVRAALVLAALAAPTFLLAAALDG
jgi:hypothetical protein